MKQKLTLALLLCASMAGAQQVSVVSSERVAEGYYPQLNAAGTQMLLTTENYQGLDLLNLASGEAVTLSDGASAGYQPRFSNDGQQVFFRVKTFEQPLSQTAVMAGNVKTLEARTLVSARRDVNSVEPYANGVVFASNRKMSKATFGTSTEPVAPYVSNEDLKLVLYKDGKRTELNPVEGQNIHYIWSSISPDGTKILFNTRKGTAVCDLEGRLLYQLGSLNAPVWYGNDYVVGMLDKDNGVTYTESCIAIAKTDGSFVQALTDPSQMGMYPSVSAAAGKIAYNTLDGQVYLMTIQIK